MYIIHAMLLVSLTLGAQTGTEKVETTFDKNTDFSTFRTYGWTVGSRSSDPKIHTLIVDAIDAEMTALGFTKAATGADVTVTYHTVASTIVDLKALDEIERKGGGPTPTLTRGRLVVTMRSVSAARQVWTASTREFLDPDPAKLDGTIRGVAARLFETYPGRKTARSK